jgi:hypothetical protein
VEWDTPEGLETILSLELPKTVVVQSSAPHRLHFWFRAAMNGAGPEFCAFRFEKAGVTADRGRYLLVPPAVHPSGAVYAFLVDPVEAPIAVLPEEKYDGLVRRARGDEAGQRERLRGDPDAKVTAGKRRETIFRFACSQRAFGASPETILEAAKALNRDRCDPPLSHDQVAHQVRGALEYEPATALPRNDARAAEGDIDLSLKAPDGPEKAIPPTRTEAGKKRIWSALELASLAPTSVPWVVPPWFAGGAVTEVEGKIKAAGKTTFMLASCGAALEGKPFMGKPTERTPVVYLTEQPGTSFVVALRRAGLAERDDFRVISLWDVDDLDWVEIVALARDECSRIGSKLLVVDTLSAFARLEGDAENQAGAAQAAVRALQVLAHEDGLAVAFGRHSRKGGGAVGESGRGSSAFAGAVDLLVSIRRREGNFPAPQRVLYTLGRFDEPPDDLVVDLTDVGYVVLGSEASVDRDIVRTTILAVAKDVALTGDELLETVKEDIGDSVSRNMVIAARKSLQTTGDIVREGKGRNEFRH